MDSVTTDKVDYLQRVGSGPAILAGPRTEGIPDARRLLQVRGVGRMGRPTVSRRHEQWRPPTAELITGMYGYRIPLVFQLTGSPDGVTISIGTWSAGTSADATQQRRMSVVESVLRGMYPVVDLDPVAAHSQAWPLGGLALGVPAPAGTDERDGAAAMDRIIRSMAGSSWSLLILGHPVSEKSLGEVRAAVLNEMRLVRSAMESERAPSPLTEQYVELLKSSLAAIGEGFATGAWRTAVYLRGDAEGYPRLASAWRSVMSGERSLPEPVRVFDRPEADELARAWALPNQPGDNPPGFYRRPFECQTLLSTPQLAACAHLPELETPGFMVRLTARFDVVAKPRQDNGRSFPLGRVLAHDQPAGVYDVTQRSLTRHAFVAGLTGSGKTNTIMSILLEAAGAGIPFMVIEPAKTEYRALIAHRDLGPQMRVFTAGKANVGPFVLNPFEVPAGTTVSEHLSLLRAVFTASFGMWTPLPQILERCLNDVFADRGWDLRDDRNIRLGAHGEEPAAAHNVAAGSASRAAQTPDAFPTLSELIAKVEEVIPLLGYDERITSDMRASLVTRLDSLRQGAKGSMLDVSRTLPPEELFGYPTVIELEALGDEGDKAFFTGLLLIRLAEHRRAQGQSPDLVHLLVVEEAHRLLANVPVTASEEAANPRGEAVQTFSNLLSEIRAYGQGVIIADQVPVRLAPDVMKNTNLKIAHQVVSADDRAALAGAMAMDDPQSLALTSLDVGEAAVFSGGDDAPLLVRIPLVKDALPLPPGDGAVRAHMTRWRADGGWDRLFRPRPFCAQTCADAAACAAARRLAEDEYVQRTMTRAVLSLIDEPSALDRTWEDVTAAARSRRPVAVRDEDLLRAFAGHGGDWYTARRGMQAAWPYPDTAEFGDRLRAVLLAQVAGVAADEPIAAFRATAFRLHARTFEPYPACHLVCTQEPPLCLYRYPVADQVVRGRYRAAWLDADEQDRGSEEHRRTQTWEVCQDAAYELVEFPDSDLPPEVLAQVDVAARRACMCFGQQMIADDRRKLPRAARLVLGNVLREAGL